MLNFLGFSNIINTFDEFVQNFTKIERLNNNKHKSNIKKGFNL